MLHFTSGDMFETPADIRVNTVNCVGVMGAGVALAFKSRYPAMFREYQKACKAGELSPGTLNVWRTVTEWIINFPTKRHWRENSRYEDIEAGLAALREYLESIGRPVRVALPALGCGHGGLDWSRVSRMIEEHLARVNAEIYVFEPADSLRAGEAARDEKRNGNGANRSPQHAEGRPTELPPAHTRHQSSHERTRAGLLMSALEVEFASRSFRAAELPYNERVFDELRARKDVFVYRRQEVPAEREVIAIPLTEDAALPHPLVELDVGDNLRALGALLQHRLSFVMAQLDLHRRRGPRARLRRINRNDDLVAKAFQAMRLECPKALAVFHKYLVTELELRVVADNLGRDALVVAVVLHRRFEIDGTAADLRGWGLDLTGLDIVDQTTKERERYLGVVERHIGDELVLNSPMGSRRAQASECAVEPSLAAFARLFEQVLSPRDAERYRAAEWRLQALTNSGTGYTDYFHRFCAYFSKQAYVEITPVIRCRFHGPVAYSDAATGAAKRLPEVEYCFSSDRSLTDQYPSRGLDRFGPFDSRTFDKKRPRLLIVAPSQHQGEVETFVRRLRDGMEGERVKRFVRGFVGTYRLARLDLDWLLLSLPPDGSPGVGARYVEALRERFEINDAPDIALVVLRDRDAYVENENPYLFAKAFLLSQGVPSQQVRLETIRQTPGSLAFTMENIAVAMYAKLGGSPWTVMPTMPVADEIVVGVGLAESGGRFEHRQRYAGITTVFRSDGSYVLAAASERCRYDEFPDVLTAFVQRTLRRLASEQGWEEGDHVRLVFHSHQPLKKTDIFRLIDRAIREVGAGILFQTAFLTIRQDHPFKIVDIHEDGREKGVRLITGGFGKKRVGVHVPRRGTVIDIGSDRRLLSVTGATLAKREGEPIPNPLLIELHPASTYRDLDSLTRQAFHFTGLSWRSMHPVGDPVTIFYSHLVAENLVRLESVPHWSDQLLDTRLRRSRWFL